MQLLPQAVNFLASPECATSQLAGDRRWEYPVAPRRRGVHAEGRVSKRGNFLIERRGKHWAIIDAAGLLVCLTVYKRGAEEVIRRLAVSPPP